MKLFNCVKKGAQAHLQMLSTKCVYKTYILYMCKQDLALNNLQLLLCHETQPNQTKSNIFNIYMYKEDFGIK